MSESGIPEITSPWTKSSFSNTLDIPNCVEVARTSQGGFALRDSKARNGAGEHTGPVLFFSGAEADAFLRGVKAGEFDL